MNALMDNPRYDDSNGCDIISDSSMHEDEQFSLCCLCGKTFPTIRSLHNHINVAHEEVADSFDFPSVEEHPRTPNSIHSEPPNPLCSREERLQPSEDSAVCVMCKKSFPGLASLRVHIDSVHHGNRSPQCEICMKTFSTLSYLRMHIATVHEGVKAYSCTFCDKSYTQKHSLKKHVASAHSTMSNKARRKLLVDSPVIHESTTVSPSGTNDS